MQQPVPVVADVRSHLKIGEASALLHEIASHPHVRDFETDVLHRAHHFAFVLRTRRRIVWVERWKLCLEIAIGTWRLDVIAARPRNITPARKSELFLVKGYDGVAILRVDAEDRKSTRLNSSHVEISYAVFCLK